MTCLIKPPFRNFVCNLEVGTTFSLLKEKGSPRYVRTRDGYVSLDNGEKFTKQMIWVYNIIFP